MNDGYSALAKWYDLFTEDIDYKSFSTYVTNLIAQFSNSEPKLFLELCCGTGNLTKYFAEQYDEVIAIDSSQNMLHYAREKEELSKVLFLQQDMKQFELYGTVDAAVCCLDGINYLMSTSELNDFFKLVHNYLNPDGIFIFDMSTIYKMQNILANNTFTYDFDDVYMVWENMQISVQKVRMNIEIFELINDDIYKRRFEVQTQRAHSIKTVEKALLSNKFEVLGIYHEFSKLPPTKESQRVFFAAKAKK